MQIAEIEKKNKKEKEEIGKEEEEIGKQEQKGRQKATKKGFLTRKRKKKRKEWNPKATQNKRENRKKEEKTDEMAKTYLAGPGRRATGRSRQVFFAICICCCAFFFLPVFPFVLGCFRIPFFSLFLPFPG